jgi:uncharacterized membrane protein HdeD (DUF308 family)
MLLKVVVIAFGCLMLAFGAFLLVAVRRDPSDTKGRVWAVAYAVLTMAAGVAAVSVIFDAVSGRTIVGLIALFVLSASLARWALKRSLVREGNSPTSVRDEAGH